MPNILIDNNKCTLCGTCTEICGAKTLEIINAKLVQTHTSSCCMCAHCAAICPQNAIEANSENFRNFKVKNIDNNSTEVEKLLIGKRSVREFKKNEIEKNILEKLIYFAEKAPSSSNQRKREYIIVTDKNKILDLEKTVLKKFNALNIILKPFIIKAVNVFSKNMASYLSLVWDDIKKMNEDFEKGEFPIFRNAPCVVCFVAPKNAVQAKDDCVIAEQYMMLYAQSLGIGSCIIGYAQYAHKAVEKKLNISKNKKIYAVAIFGYSKFKYKKEIEFLNKPKTTWF